MKCRVVSKVNFEQCLLACKFRVHSWAQGMIPSGSVCVEKKLEKNFTKTYIFKKLCGEIP